MHEPTRFRVLGFVALALLACSTVVPACSSSKNDATLAALAGNCAINSDCTSPLVCVFETCHVECNTDQDCAAKSLGLCIESDKPYRVCQNPSEEDCTRNSDCAGTQICGVDDRCRNACVTSKDCITGQECVSGACAAPSELINGALTVADSGIAGQSCLLNSDCPGTLVCILGVCTVECITDKDCELGSVCIDTRCAPAGYTGTIPSTSSDGGGSMSASDGSVGASDASNDGSSGVDSGCGGLTLCGGTCVDTNTSPTNCGGCGVPCATTCSNGHCEVPTDLATGQGDPLQLAVYGGYVYWSDFNSGGALVSKIASDGSGMGMPITVASGTGSATTLAVDGTNVYWTFAAGTNTQAVWKANIATGTETVLASNQSSPFKIAVDDTNVYWINGADGPGTGNISMAPISATETVTPIAPSLDGPWDLVVLGGVVYWTDSVDGTVMSVPRGGGTSSRIASGQFDPLGLVTDGTFVYWVNGEGSDGNTNDGSIMKVSITSGRVRSLALDQNTPTAIAIDSTSTYIYWSVSTATGGAIMKASAVDGSGSTLLVTDTEPINDIVLDSNSVYWTNTQGPSRTIHKVSPR